MFCKNCGNNIPDSASFCSKCGTAVSSPQPAPQPPVADTQDKTMAYGYDNTAVYQPPVYPNIHPAPEAPKKKTGLIIALAAIGAVLIIAVTVALTVFLGNSDSPVKTKEEETTIATSATTKPELIDDPISYFIQQPDGYYKVTTDPSADFYIYPEYGSDDHYTTRFAGNELIFVYGTYNGWACFEFTDSANGYAWCKTASIYKTDETPTQPEPETVYVPTTPSYNPAPSYSPVMSGSYYRVSGTGGDGLNLRSSPSTSAYVYVVLQESELVYVHRTDGIWAYVSTVDHRTGNNYEGWCANQYLAYAY